jgi:hypothetical protein
MSLHPISCPFDPRLMVVVLQIALCGRKNDNALGVSMMEALSPDERLLLFDACDWFRHNPNWDRWTYASKGA